MNFTAVFDASVITAGVAFLVFILAVKMRRDLKHEAAGPHSFEEQPPEVTRGPTREYGAKDCYVDCMRAFRWDSKERGECSEACGLPRT